MKDSHTSIPRRSPARPRSYSNATPIHAKQNSFPELAGSPSPLALPTAGFSEEAYQDYEYDPDPEEANSADPSPLSVHLFSSSPLVTVRSQGGNLSGLSSIYLESPLNSVASADTTSQSSRDPNKRSNTAKSMPRSNTLSSNSVNSPILSQATITSGLISDATSRGSREPEFTAGNQLQGLSLNDDDFGDDPSGQVGSMYNSQSWQVKQRGQTRERNVPEGFINALNTMGSDQDNQRGDEAEVIAIGSPVYYRNNSLHSDGSLGPHGDPLIVAEFQHEGEVLNVLEHQPSFGFLTETNDLEEQPLGSPLSQLLNSCIAADDLIQPSFSQRSTLRSGFSQEEQPMSAGSTNRSTGTTSTRRTAASVKMITLTSPGFSNGTKRLRSITERPQASTAETMSPCSSPDSVSGSDGPGHKGQVDINEQFTPTVENLPSLTPTNEQPPEIPREDQVYIEDLDDAKGIMKSEESSELASLIKAFTLSKRPIISPRPTGSSNRRKTKPGFFRVGDIVCIEGITHGTNAKLNGQTGHVLSYMSAARRYRVRLESGKRATLPPSALRLKRSISSKWMASSSSPRRNSRDHPSINITTTSSTPIQMAQFGMGTPLSSISEPIGIPGNYRKSSPSNIRQGIVWNAGGVHLRVGRELTTAHVGVLPQGTKIQYSQIKGNRVQIMRPLVGWASMKNSKTGQQMIHLIYNNNDEPDLDDEPSFRTMAADSSQSLGDRLGNRTSLRARTQRALKRIAAEKNQLTLPLESASAHKRAQTELEAVHDLSSESRILHDSRRHLPGDRVQVWSKQKDAWVIGTIVQQVNDGRFELQIDGKIVKLYPSRIKKWKEPDIPRALDHDDEAEVPSYALVPPRISSHRQISVDSTGTTDSETFKVLAQSNDLLAGTELSPVVTPFTPPHNLHRRVFSHPSKMPSPPKTNDSPSIHGIAALFETKTKAFKAERAFGLALQGLNIRPRVFASPREDPVSPPSPYVAKHRYTESVLSSPKTDVQSPDSQRDGLARVTSEGDLIPSGRNKATLGDLVTVTEVLSYKNSTVMIPVGTMGRVVTENPIRVEWLGTQINRGRVGNSLDKISVVEKAGHELKRQLTLKKIMSGKVSRLSPAVSRQYRKMVEHSVRNSKARGTELHSARHRSTRSASPVTTQEPKRSNSRARSASSPAGKKTFHLVYHSHYVRHKRFSEWPLAQRAYSRLSTVKAKLIMDSSGAELEVSGNGHHAEMCREKARELVQTRA